VIDIENLSVFHRVRLTFNINCHENLLYSHEFGIGYLKTRQYSEFRLIIRISSMTRNTCDLRMSVTSDSPTTAAALAQQELTMNKHVRNIILRLRKIRSYFSIQLRKTQ